MKTPITTVIVAGQKFDVLSINKEGLTVNVYGLPMEIMFNEVQQDLTELSNEAVMKVVYLVYFESYMFDSKYETFATKMQNRCKLTPLQLEYLRERWEEKESLLNEE